MVKICCYGTCKSDTRHPDPRHKVIFFPFPKTKSNREKCLRWIKACGRPHSDLNVYKINKDKYVCSKHFKEPSSIYPDPIPADGSAIFKARRPPLKRILNLENSGQSSDERNQKELSSVPDKKPAEVKHGMLQSGLELLSAASTIRDLERENAGLKKDLAAKVLGCMRGRKP
ncbi:uncharacterized protein LOC119733458 [Patiria miniata]|uniref:THAP-type domain-containing protein n=1 Tax=Patiria miniata TaxID=46514 RepID=A0A914AHE0_PATMI|nr:uncharacterized protein LOC119733458 [Patiria miniata]